MKTFRHLIFDLDGTLIDSSGGVVDAVNYSLRQVGAPPQPAERIKPFIGFPLSVMYREFTDAPLEDLYRHFRVRAAEVIVASTTALDGVAEALRSLKSRGYVMAIATTKIRTHVVGIVDLLGWQELFTCLVGGDEVAQVKPAPEAFSLTLNRLGATAHTALVIGDTINDVLAAQAVPISVVAVQSPYGGYEALAAARPDFLLPSVAALPDLLQKLNNGAK